MKGDADGSAAPGLARKMSAKTQSNRPANKSTRHFFGMFDFSNYPARSKAVWWQVILNSGFQRNDRAVLPHDSGRPPSHDQLSTKERRVLAHFRNRCSAGVLARELRRRLAAKSQRHRNGALTAAETGCATKWKCPIEAQDFPKSHLPSERFGVGLPRPMRTGYFGGRWRCELVCDRLARRFLHRKSSQWNAAASRQSAAGL